MRSRHSTDVIPTQWKRKYNKKWSNPLNTIFKLCLFAWLATMTCCGIVIFQLHFWYPFHILYKHYIRTGRYSAVLICVLLWTFVPTNSFYIKITSIWEHRTADTVTTSKKRNDGYHSFLITRYTLIGCIIGCWRVSIISTGDITESPLLLMDVLKWIPILGTGMYFQFHLS
jgi:hypothetical protein